MKVRTSVVMEEEYLNDLNEISKNMSNMNDRLISRSETIAVLIDAVCNMFGGPDKVANVVNSHYKNGYNKIDRRKGREMPSRKGMMYKSGISDSLPPY